MFFGALAQSLPDIDFISSFWLGTAEDLLAHRGFTHSIVFAILSTILLSYLANRFFPKQKLARRGWILLFGINIFTHLFIDCFNVYGTGIFEPFSHYRVSFNSLFVADPLFTIWPLAAFIALLWLRKGHVRRKIWCVSGIGISCVYLCFALINKINIDSDIKQSFYKQGIQYKKYLTTPTPLNNLLWYVVAGDSAGFYVGYRSVFDSDPQITYNYFPQRTDLLQNVKDHQQLQHLQRFSQGFYTAEKWNDTLVFNDLRFGQIVGWHNAREKFVFHYFLEHPSVNGLVVQRGRFAKWNYITIHSLWERIKGN